MIPRWNIPLLLVVAVASNGCAAPAGSHEQEVFPNRRAPIEARGHRLGYVANELSDDVSVLDLDDGVELVRVPVGRDPVEIDGPRDAVLDPERGFLYVLLGYPLRVNSAHDPSEAALHQGFVQSLELTDLAPVAELKVGAHPAALALSPSGQELAVVQDTEQPGVTETLERVAADVLFLDLDTVWAPAGPSTRKSPVCVAPVAATYAKAPRLYVACSGEDSIAVMDSEDGAVVESLSAGETRAEQPGALGVDASGTQLVLSNRVSRESVVFALGDSSQVKSRTIVPGVPGQAAWTGTDEYLVPVRDPGGAVVVRASDGGVQRQRTFTDAECAVPTSATALGDGRVFVVCAGDGYQDGTVVELDRATLEIRNSMGVGTQPDRLEVGQ